MVGRPLMPLKCLDMTFRAKQPIPRRGLSRVEAATYFAVRVDIRLNSLSDEEIGIIAEKFVAALLRQPFVHTEIMTAKICNHDAPCSLVITLLT